jgi:hypothetical protein
MAPQVRKVKSAFLFYQGEELKKVRDELGISVGEAMTEVSNRVNSTIGLGSGWFRQS